MSKVRDIRKTGFEIKGGESGKQEKTQRPDTREEKAWRNEKGVGPFVPDPG